MSGRRYSYRNQAEIGQWNLVQLANALLGAELLEKEEAEEVLGKYSEVRTVRRARGEEGEAGEAGLRQEGLGYAKGAVGGGIGGGGGGEQGLDSERRRVRPAM